MFVWYWYSMVWHEHVPNLVETSLPHFSRQSLQQSFPGNFGGEEEGGVSTTPSEQPSDEGKADDFDDEDIENSGWRWWW